MVALNRDQLEVILHHEANRIRELNPEHSFAVYSLGIWLRHGETDYCVCGITPDGQLHTYYNEPFLFCQSANHDRAAIKHC